MRYVLPAKQAAYDEKYSQRVKGGQGLFRQVDREESLIHLLRVNLLKRMESAVSSFALMIERQLHDVESVLDRIDRHVDGIEDFDIADLDLENPDFEALLVGQR